MVSQKWPADQSAPGKKGFNAVVILLLFVFSFRIRNSRRMGVNLDTGMRKHKNLESSPADLKSL
jgi:hypothetical protein